MLAPDESWLISRKVKGPGSGAISGAILGELAALANAVVWALTGVITKGVGKNVRPTHIVAMQAWIGLALLLSLGLLVGQIDDLWRVPIRSALLLAGGAVINTIGALVFWIAISRSKVSTVYPTTQSIFILVSVAAGWMFLDDVPQAGVVGGAILIIGGVVLLNFRATDLQPGSKSSGDYVALSLAAITAFLWAGGFVTTAIGLEDTAPLPAATIRNLVPAALFVVISLIFPSTRISRVYRGNVVRLTTGAILFAISALSFVFALDNAPPGVVVVLINTSPMWAVVLAAVVLRERLTRFTLGGAALSLCGIFAVLAFR